MGERFEEPILLLGIQSHCFRRAVKILKEDGKVEELVWRAQSFLCVLEDAGMTKKVRVIEGAAFGWGFDTKSVRGTGGGAERKIVVTEVGVLDLEKEWAERLVLLKKEYPDWTFSDLAGR